MAVIFYQHQNELALRLEVVAKLGIVENRLKRTRKSTDPEFCKYLYELSTARMCSQLRSPQVQPTGLPKKTLYCSALLSGLLTI